MHLFNIMSFLAMRKKILLHIHFEWHSLSSLLVRENLDTGQRFDRNTGWWSTVWHTYTVTQGLKKR